MLLFICFVPQILQAGVQARWLSVTSTLIEDGETKILFDAAFTRPTALNWLGLSPFKSKKDVVLEVLQGQGLSSLSAVFVTHTHFDHCVDAPLVAKMTKAPLYASDGMEIIAKAYRDPEIAIRKLGNTIVGQFKISIFSRVHSHILGIFEFLPGKVPADFDFNFYDYKVGESWIYLLEHPAGSVLIDTSGDANLAVLPKGLKVDVVFQGVANRKSDQTVIDGYVKTLSAKKFIATHFDYFMFSFMPGPQEAMINVDFAALRMSFKKEAPGTEFIIPEYGKPIPLF